MAISVIPTAWLDNYSSDGTNITVPIATFPELSVAEAATADGDIRKIMLAVCEKMYQEFLANDQPTKMTIGRVTGVDDATGVITRVYTFTFLAAAVAGGIEVSAES